MFYGYSAYTDLYLAIKMLLLVIFGLALDFYVYRGSKILFSYIKSKNYHKTGMIVHWLSYFSLLVVIAIYFIRGGAHLDDPNRSVYYYFIATYFFILYGPKSVFAIFILMHDLLSIIKYIYGKITRKRIISTYLIRKYFLKLGLTLSILSLVAIVYGVAVERNKFKVKKIVIKSDQLPQSFDGYKIVQISDIHLGSYKNAHFFDEAFDKINDLDADMVVNTGDMINYSGFETDSWIEAFQRINGFKLSILGNHDYGDYVGEWTKEEKKNSTERLVKNQQTMGFRVLRNELIPLVKDEDTIYIIGVDNTSPGHYKSYGRLNEIIHDIPYKSFKILLTHDPEHWEFEVVTQNYPINLTLSGHTHGGQMGFKFGIFRWSPVSKLYRFWGGLYKDSEKQLYINTGLGCIGYLGRIGMTPEITEITLRMKM